MFLALEKDVAYPDIYGLTDHSFRVGMLAFKFSKYLKIQDKEALNIYIAGSLHDIGKYVVGSDIFNKPSKLNIEEIKRMKEHPLYSYNLLKLWGFDIEICNIAKYHHENYNGNGYPDGLRGKEIPIGSRILKVCDVYDALTNDRAYRNKINNIYALDEMLKEAYNYDPYILKKFISYIKTNKKGEFE